MTGSRFLPLATYTELPPQVMQQRVDNFEAQLQRRRSVRQFSNHPVPRTVIEKCLLAAVHTAGPVSLSHTPSPIGLLCDILGRPKGLERPYTLLVVGYLNPQASVPNLQR